MGRPTRPRRGGRNAALSLLQFCAAGNTLVYRNEKRGKRALKLSGPFFVP